MVGLLVLTFFATLAAFTVRVTGPVSAVAAYLMAPAIIAAVAGLFDCVDKRRRLRWLRTSLVIVVLISLAAPLSLAAIGYGGIAVSLVVVQCLLTLFFWPPQYAIVVSSLE